MLDYVNIGSVPSGEDCEQLGPDYDAQKARKESQIFAKQLRRQFPDADFKVKSFFHDFGTYFEVVAFFDSENEESVDAAFKAENNMPEFWDDEAKEEIAALILA